jgi:hypothetical protein
MATTTVTVNLSASASRVWQLIGGFGSLPDWLTFLSGSELSEGGRVRSLTDVEGGVVVEQLEKFDNDGRTYTYTVLDAPFPVTGYRSTLAVYEVDDSHSRVDWSGTFEPAGVPESEAIALFHGIYTNGLASLQKRLDA